MFKGTHQCCNLLSPATGNRNPLLPDSGKIRVYKQLVRTSMVDAEASPQHLTETQNLGQLLVIALKSRNCLLKEHMYLALLSGGGEVQSLQCVCQDVHSLLGKAEHHGGQQLPVGAHLSVT